ncbi:MAG: OmpA family protein [Firmicutes bacterium]|nr:OmpA family protein [Bacillota bacterium]
MVKKLLILFCLIPMICIGTAQAAPLTNFDVYNGSVDLGGWRTEVTSDHQDFSGQYRLFGSATWGLNDHWGLRYSYYDIAPHDRTPNQSFNGSTNELNLLYSLGKDSNVALFAGVNHIRSEYCSYKNTYNVAQAGVIATAPLNDRLKAYAIIGAGGHNLVQTELGLSANLRDDWQANIGYRWFRIKDAYNEPTYDSSGTIKTKGILVSVTHFFGKKAAPVIEPPKPPIPQTPPKPITPPVIRETPKIEKIVLKGVNFDFDKDTLQPQAYPILNKVITLANQHPDWDFVLIGHTDSIGSDEYNMDLSLRRVKTVQYYLIGQGITENRLTLEAKGEREPIATNDTAEGRAENRRVEIFID